MNKKVVGLRNIITGGAVVLAAGLGTVGVASAATTHTVTHLTAKSASTDLATDPGHGPGEAPLTGATLTSAVAAANAAVPNATVIRAESGPNSTYEVHMKKADGSLVTVVENASFVVTSTHADAGTPPFGPGGPGGPGHFGHGPGEAPLTGATLTSAVAAANAAVPNATVIRAEAGPNSTYEVHMKKADGSLVTVVENASFVVTSTHADAGTPPFGAPPVDVQGGPRN